MYNNTMGKRILKSSRSAQEYREDRHRFEHWYVDNQVYFITARVRDKFHALAGDKAKGVFWNRFDHYTKQYDFVPWVTSVLDNHYHTIGYLRTGTKLQYLMQRLHGSVAKLVNDLLGKPHREFWRDTKGREYFDGCIRDEKQARLAYRYTLTQSERHGVCADYREYEHTHVNIDLDLAVRRAHEIKAFLEGVPYKRYEH